MRIPVVFVHGAWLHALSWEPWEERFADHGYVAYAPGWPGEPATAREARERPEGVPDLGLDDLLDHYAEVVRSFASPPVIVGHSVGGLIAQRLLGAGLGQAAVALAPAPIGDVPLPECPDLAPAPSAPADAPVVLPPERFRVTFANTVTEEEAGSLYERYAVPAPRRLLRDLGCGGAPRNPLALADTSNTRRGPLLLVSGQEDRVVPDEVTRAVYKEYGDSTALTDLKQFADRGHLLIADNGWRAVADHVLGWLDEHGAGPT